MFKVTRYDHEAMPNYEAGRMDYSTVKGVGMSRSPKRAYAKARAEAWNAGGAGTPILSQTMIERDGKLVAHTIG